MPFKWRGIVESHSTVKWANNHRNVEISHQPYYRRSREQQHLVALSEYNNHLGNTGITRERERIGVKKKPRISLFGPNMNQINYLLVTFLLDWRQTGQCIHLEKKIIGETREEDGCNEKLISTQE